MQGTMMRTAIGLTALFLAGCSWSDVLIAEIKSAPADSSFGYQGGYEAGCKTGIAEKGGLGFDKPAPQRDERRFQGEADYRRGWDQGSGNCASRYAGLFAPYYPPGR